MTEQWERITALFGAARLLEPAKRAAFLEAACGQDTALRHEVERLLADSAQDDSFLAEPPPILIDAAVDVDASVVGLAAGTRLGGYEVGARIGRGGMGDVYRARDLTLHRDVAIKVLPTVAAADAERRSRFEREARAVAALNHPNIVTIYSVEHANDRFFLTMELVEGRPLAEIIPAGGFSLDRMLGIAIPLADAVAAAHQKGITHRDLKPANIMIGDSAQGGRVKVLDFGLAKLTDGVAAVGEATAMPTTAITSEGRILGTVAYMSPEQAEGKPVDARSDLFSLGVILFEMATGTRPFGGETSMSIISSILRDTPKSVTDLNPAMPGDLARIIRRALSKDPERRYQTAKDLRNDLEELNGAPVPGDPRTRHLRRILSGAVAAGVIIAAALYFLPKYGERIGILRRSSSLQDFQITPLTTSGDAALPAISPDGKYVVYGRQDEKGHSLWLKQIATSRDVEIVASEPSVYLGGATITPDGAFVDFVRTRRSGVTLPELWRVPLLGGTPKKLVDMIVSSLVAWSHDGRRMAFTAAISDGAGGPPRSTALVVADADGGHPRFVATRHPPVFLSMTSATGYGHPAWSPDGRMVATLESNFSNGDASVTPLVIDIASGRTRYVPSLYRVSTLEWPRAETFLVSGASHSGAPAQLFYVDAATGRPSPLTNDLNDYAGVSLTADGRTLAASRFAERTRLWVGDTNGRDITEVPTSSASHLWRSMLAWANGRVLHTAAANGTVAVISVAPDATGRAETIVEGTDMAVSRDGKTLVFISATSNVAGGEIWKSDIDGSHRVRVASGQAVQPALSKDGETIFFTSGRNPPLQKLWTVPTRGGEPVELAHRLAVRPAVSPDGTQLAFGTVDDHNRFTLMVCDLPGCVNQRTIGSNARYGRWLPSGAAIAYVDAEEERNLYVQPLDGSAPTQLTHFTDSRIQDFGWSGDGTRLAILRSETLADVVLFNGLRSRN